MSNCSEHKKEFTINETIALMHQDSVETLRSIANIIEKFKMDRVEIIEFLRDISDNKEAQIIVVKLRDEL